MRVPNQLDHSLLSKLAKDYKGITILTANDDIYQQTSKNKLEYLLEIHGEPDNHDFKESYSLKTQEEKAKLVHNILAFANTEGGGHLIFGVVDRTYEPVGLPEGVHLDQTHIYNVLKEYTDKVKFVVAEYELERPDWIGKRRFGILYIAEAPIPVLPRKKVEYLEKGQKHTKILANENDIVVRRGGQSIKADQENIYRLYNKKPLSSEADSKGKIRKQWRGLETLKYPLLNDNESNRNVFVNDLAYSLHQTFANKGYTKFTSLFRLSKESAKGLELPIYELICHQAEFCEAIRQRATRFISKAFSIKESNLDIEGKDRLKNMRREEISREHEAFFSTWKVHTQVAFTSHYHALELSYDPATNSITIYSMEKASLDPSSYPERVHTTSDLLRYIASLQVIKVGSIGHLEWYANNYPLMKLLVEVLDKQSFDLNRVKININDYEEWDYDSGTFDEEIGQYK